MYSNKKPIFLVILDGFGYSPKSKHNAIAQAAKPHFDNLLQRYSYTFLKASGTAVGLLNKQPGNSEVGHLTIGSGRIITQDITRITRAIENKSFFKNETLHNTLQAAAQNNKVVHLLGLLSDGGVHSYQPHISALLEATHHYTLKNIWIHAFLDGRDVPPKSAAYYLHMLDQQMKPFSNAQLATISGRFYAMDRDHNWERTAACYNVLTQNQHESFSSWHEILKYYYTQNITDEFIPPTQLISEGTIKNNDTIIFFNFRPDRMRQLVSAFYQKNFDHFTTVSFSGKITTMTRYAEYLNTEILFKRIHISNTLKQVLNTHNRSMFTIAETEKYAHVTYFFDGMQEKEWKNETRILIPSLPVKTYITHPEMSAPQITQTIIDSLNTQVYDFYLINYANADMVAHSGNFAAAIKAIECLDKQLATLYRIIKKINGILLITADHGKAEEMVENDQPKTAHTRNPVYFIAVDTIKQDTIAHFNNLADIAPFILSLMQLPIPQEMKK